jgi:hypothetical protein
MFYVYTITDPRNDAIFYIGKGQRDRMHHHVREAKNPISKGNLQKLSRIREILQLGLEPIATKIAAFTDELEALSHERHLIATTPGLTNISLGGGATSRPRRTRLPKRKSKSEAIRYWNNMKYFKRWLSVVETWPGFTFPGVENGDAKAQELVNYITHRVAEWEALKQRLRNQIPLAA